MKISYKGIVIGLSCATGVVSFFSGEFIFSTLLFAFAATYTNLAGRIS